MDVEMDPLSKLKCVVCTVQFSVKILECAQYYVHPYNVFVQCTVYIIKHSVAPLTHRSVGFPLDYHWSGYNPAGKKTGYLLGIIQLNGYNL